MGKSQSRVLTVSEARGLLGEEQWARLDRGFHRLADKQALMHKDTFFHDVLAAAVPKELAERLFAVFDHSHRGALNKEDFLCGMAVLAGGLPQHKIKLLFHIYDLDRKGTIHKDNLKELAKALKDITPAKPTHNTTADNTEQPIDNNIPPENVHEAIDQLYKTMDLNQDDQISFDEFKTWAEENMTPGLISWIWELAPREKNTYMISSSSENLKKGVAGEGVSIWRSRTATIASITNCKSSQVCLITLIVPSS